MNNPRSSLFNYEIFKYHSVQHYQPNLCLKISVFVCFLKDVYISYSMYVVKQREHTQHKVRKKAQLWSNDQEIQFGCEIRAYRRILKGNEPSIYIIQIKIKLSQASKQSKMEQPSECNPSGIGIPMKRAPLSTISNKPKESTQRALKAINEGRQQELNSGNIETVLKNKSRIKVESNATASAPHKSLLDSPADDGNLYSLPPLHKNTTGHNYNLRSTEGLMDKEEVPVADMTPDEAGDKNYIKVLKKALIEVVDQNDLLRRRVQQLEGDLRQSRANEAAKDKAIMELAALIEVRIPGNIEQFKEEIGLGEEDTNRLTEEDGEEEEDDPNVEEGEDSDVGDAESGIESDEEI